LNAMDFGILAEPLEWRLYRPEVRDQAPLCRKYTNSTPSARNGASALEAIPKLAAESSLKSEIPLKTTGRPGGAYANAPPVF